MPPWVPAAVLIPVGFALWWAFILWLAGWMSGWRSLARRYPAPDHFDGTRRHFQSVQLGWSNYGGGTTVGTNADGLYLAVFLLFRPGHPPIFVPWSEVSSAEFVKKWYGSRLELRFAGVPGLVLRLPNRLGRKVAEDANRSWGTAAAGEEPPA